MKVNVAKCESFKEKKWKYIEKTQNLYLEIFYFYYIFPHSVF